MTEDFWIPLVDEPIGEIVTRIEAEHEEVRQLVATPEKLLAFRTFAYLRVGIVLGELLVDYEAPAADAGQTWVEQLAADPAIWQRLVEEVREVAEHIDEEALADPAGSEQAARKRFRAFAKRALMDE